MIRIGNSIHIKNIYERTNPFLDVLDSIEKSIKENSLFSFNPISYNEGSRKNYIYSLKKKYGLKQRVKELINMPKDELQKLLPTMKLRKGKCVDITLDDKLERFMKEKMKKYYEKEIKKNSKLIDLYENKFENELEKKYEEVYNKLENCGLDVLTRNQLTINSLILHYEQKTTDENELIRDSINTFVADKQTELEI